MNIPIAAIEIGERVRRDKGDIELQAYRMSLHGQLVPIIVEPKENGYILVAGERRILAAKRLGWEEIEAIFRHDLDDVSRLELELEENLTRKDFNWEEQIAAEAKLHQLKQAQYGKALPGRFSADGWTQKDTADSLGVSTGMLSEDLRLAEGVKKFPELRMEKSKRLALQKLRRLEQALTNTMLVSAELETKIIESFVQDDFITKADTIPNLSAKLIFADLDGHQPHTVIPKLERILATGGQMFVFLPSMNMYAATVSSLTMSGLQCYTEPYIWHVKGEDLWHSFLWASKDLKSPSASLRKVYSYARDKSSIHTSEKPYRLLFNLLQYSSLRGDFILEPFGRGGTLVQVCLELARNVQSYQASASMYKEAIQQVKVGLSTVQPEETEDVGG